MILLPIVYSELPGSKASHYLHPLAHAEPRGREIDYAITLPLDQGFDDLVLDNCRLLITRHEKAKHPTGGVERPPPFPWLDKHIIAEKLANSPR